MSTDQEKKLALFEEAQSLAKEEQLEWELPHLFSFKPYQWTLDYWNSTNRMKFICSGNQCGKSSAQIRHCIDLATDPKKWGKYFPRRRPVTFWYIYPDGNKIAEEFDQKWEREFMPRGAMKNHAQYGWKKIYHRNNFVGVKFFSGVTLYFKSWRQDFQSATIDACFVDEEIPFDLYDELSQRINMADGIYSMVFTATIGQKEWYEVLELQGKHGERFPKAFKRQVSMEYDCQFYADGTPSPFTPEEVERRKAKCSSEREVNRRIHGRFVSDEGLAFPSFNRSKNVKKRSEVDKTWLFFGGVDIGTGGRDGHPAAISLVAVRPDFQFGKLFKFWKGNKYETTNTSQILNKYIEMTKGLVMTGSFYDWHSKEFALRAQAAAVPFQKADKAQDFGYDLLNTLFRNNMLDIEEGPYTDGLIYEMEHLKMSSVKSRKGHAEDDGCFAKGTLISSEKGNVPIEKISVGDFVFTRNGLKKVISLSKHISEIYEFSHDEFGKIKCTKNHKFYDRRIGQFVRIDNLSSDSKFMRFEECQKEKKSYLMELSIGGIRSQNIRLIEGILSHQAHILKKGFRLSIKRFGNSTMGRFLQSTMFTIRMVIFQTTTFPILSFCMSQSTALITQTNIYQTQKIGRKTASTWRKSGRWPLNGIPQKKAESFIKQLGSFLGRWLNSMIISANIAKIALKAFKNGRSFAATPVNLHIEGLWVTTTLKEYVRYAQKNFRKVNTPKQKPAQKNVDHPIERKKIGDGWVYNITVEDDHEFFANGVLVANCDSLRYSVSSIAWDFSHITTVIPMEQAKPKRKKNTRLDPEFYERRQEEEEAEWNFENDIDEYNDLLGGF